MRNVFVNQLHLKPVLVDIVAIRAPRESSTDLNIALRSIANQLSTASGKITIRYRHKGRRKKASIALKPISIEVSRNAISGAVKVRKGLRERHELFRFNATSPRRKGILYVFIHPEALYLDPGEILLKLADGSIRLSEIVTGYDAIGLIVEGEIDKIPRELIERINVKTFVLPQDYKSIAYRVFRYSS